MDKVKFSLEYSSMFLPNVGTLRNVEQHAPMKDAHFLVTDQYVSFEDVMSFLDALLTTLKISEESSNDENVSHCKKHCLPLRII